MISDTLILYRAEINRFYRSGIFRKAAALLGGILTLITVADLVLTFMGKGPGEAPFVACLAGIVLSSSMISAMILCPFTGADFECGTIRNRLISGYDRKSVYFSGLLASVSGILSLVVLAAGICGVLFCAFSLEASYSFVNTIKLFAVCAALTVLVMLPSLSCCYAVTMMLGNQSKSGFLCSAAAFVTFVAGAVLCVLRLPDVGVVSETAWYTNAVIKVLPIGQIVNLVIKINENSGPANEILSILIVNLGLTVVSSAFGFYVFNRKNIK